MELCGWVNAIRDFGGSKFLVLRDRYGISQVVVGPQSPQAARDVTMTLRDEWVVKVVGKVAPRPDGQTNPAMATGEIEVIAEQVIVLNPSEIPPFTPSQVDELPNEDMRLKYRYIDLRASRCSKPLPCGIASSRSCAITLTKTSFSKSRLPFLAAALLKEPAITLSQVASIPATFMRYRNHHKSTNRS